MTLSEWYSHNLPFGCYRDWSHRIAEIGCSVSVDVHSGCWHHEYAEMLRETYASWLKVLVSMNRQFVRGWTRNRADWRFKVKTDAKAMWNKRAFP